MKLDRARLREIIVQTATRTFGGREFARAQLLDVVEEQLRREGHWSVEDDAPLASDVAKSKGRSVIDCAISELHAQGKLAHVDWEAWRVRLSDSGGNGTSQASERDRRLQALRKFAGKSDAPSPPIAAFDRSQLY